MTFARFVAAQVTTIDSQETTVMAGCLDTYISKWDLR